MNTTDHAPRRSSDWVRQPVHWFFLWCLPLAAGFVAGGVLPARQAAAVWAAAFVWMGVACLANALRCHRLHCYISGPVFLLGAVVAALVAAAAPLSSLPRLHTVVSATLLLVLVSYVPELIWRSYLHGDREP